MRVIWILDRGQAVNIFAYTCIVNLIDKSCILSLFVQIPSIPTGLFVSAKGEGCCLMQVLLVSGKHNPTFSPRINDCTLRRPPPHLEANPSLATVSSLSRGNSVLMFTFLPLEWKDLVKLKQLYARGMFFLLKSTPR